MAQDRSVIIAPVELKMMANARMTPPQNVVDLTEYQERANAWQ